MFIPKHAITPADEEALRLYYSSGYCSLTDFLAGVDFSTVKCLEPAGWQAYIDHILQPTLPEHFPDTYLRSKADLLRLGCSLACDRQDITYIEFGVRQGVSMSTAASAISSPTAQLFGLDTFTGLPDGWVPAYGNRGRINKARQPGEMAVAAMPTFDDRRITLIKGLFQDTLGFILPSIGTRRLIINIDGDTYTAALFGLASLHSFFKSGDVIYFDEFADELNEFAAFNDYVRSFYMKERFKLVGRAYDGFLFQVV